MGTVDVGDEVDGWADVVVLQRLSYHQRPQVRAPNADVDHVGDTLPGVADPLAGDNLVGEFTHVCQNGIDLRGEVRGESYAISHQLPPGTNLRHYVLPVDEDGLVGSVA